MKKARQQFGLVWQEKRPREYATEMLKDLREYWVRWMDEKEVPQQYRGLVSDHVISVVAKARYRKKSK